jgi:hypothetical protein
MDQIRQKGSTTAGVAWRVTAEKLNSTMNISLTLSHCQDARQMITRTVFMFDQS